MTASDRIEQLLASGELARVAKDCASQNELCRRIGMSKDAFISARIRLIARGVQVPGFEELRKLGELTNKTSQPISATDVDFLDEMIAERWPSLARFDAEQGAVDVVPVGHTIKGVSSLVGSDGEVKAQWIKTTTTEQDDRAVLLEAIRNIAAHWPSIPDAIEPPQHSDDDLLCVYPMGDPHIGMLAWAPETGENFDLEIAERNLVGAVDHLALLAPPAKRAMIVTVGDTFHSDGLANTTTAGTRVDVDGRTSKMIDVGVRTFRRLIHRALMRHEEVEVKIAPGNHDALLSVVLRVALSQFFENEPRVHIDQSPEDFLWYRFGANMLGVNHGHRAKADSLMQAMAVDRAKDWGETRHRRMYTGHVHHETTKEVPGCTVDTLNTLASSDDWHRRQGYRATRHMRMDIIHRDFGLINRHIVGIEQLRLRAA